MYMLLLGGVCVHGTTGRCMCTCYYWEVYVRISLLAFGFYINLPHYFEFIGHVILLLLLLLLLKKVSSEKLGESDRVFGPYQSEDPRSAIPTYRQKEEKGKESRRL